MNVRSKIVASLAAGAASTAALLVYAGPLDPPGGAPSSTHKTLGEVEPRIAINLENTPGDADSLYRITQSGTYYLTRNIHAPAGYHGIEIAASEVTIDLMGFRVGGSPGSLDGIRTTTALRNITIRNGSIRAWGQDGIVLADGEFGSALVENVQVSNCGDEGIDSGSNALVRGCTAAQNTGAGIAVSAHSTVESCLAYANGFGIHGRDDSIITRCNATANQWDGLIGSNQCLIKGCTSSKNGRHGIVAQSRNIVRGNVCNENGTSGTGAGVTTHDDNRVEDNMAHGNESGFQATGLRNLFIRNHAYANTNNYAIDTDNFVGLKVSTENSMNLAENANVNWSF